MLNSALIFSADYFLFSSADERYLIVVEENSLPQCVLAILLSELISAVFVSTDWYSLPKVQNSSLFLNADCHSVPHC